MIFTLKLDDQTFVLPYSTDIVVTDLLVFVAVSELFKSEIILI